MSKNKQLEQQIKQQDLWYKIRRTIEDKITSLNLDLTYATASLFGMLHNSFPENLFNAHALKHRLEIETTILRTIIKDCHNLQDLEKIIAHHALYYITYNLRLGHTYEDDYEKMRSCPYDLRAKASAIARLNDIILKCKREQKEAVEVKPK